MKKIIVLLACVGLLGAFELQKPSYSFCNTSINYLDWSHRVESEPAREDFAFLEVEGVGGLGYAYANGGLFARAFLTAHYQRSTYYDGENGYMGGWFWRYDFEAWGEKWYAFQWHEVEFERAKEHYMLSEGTRIGDGASWGLNGDVALFFRATDALDLGMQYRYAYQKLGLSLYQNGMIYSMKYNF